MKILFEEYAYPSGLVGEFTNDLRPRQLKDGNVAFCYVGYYYSSSLNDSVFVLPKVFINQKKGDDGKERNLAFGAFEPEKIIDTRNEDNPLRGTKFYGHLFQLSVWIYRAIDRYRQRHESEEITEAVDVLSTESAQGDKSGMLINAVLDLLRFNKDHKDLFTYIAKLSSQGHSRVNWQKTISRVTPTLQNGQPVYLKTYQTQKEVNADEELIVLFFSVIDYLHQKFHFPVFRSVHYKTNPRGVERLIVSGKGARLLRKIRRKYFKDDLVKLWNLLDTFFHRAEQMRSKRAVKEYLLVRNFNLVFEDMIDCLISDDTREMDAKLADQRDGKIVDHIYRYESLVRQSDIYYIGDSKYYKEGSDPGDDSIYKQFTYAKNVIQRNMELKEPSVTRINRGTYYDSATEGYNVTPNFFIRGIVDSEVFDFRFSLEPTMNDGKPDVERLSHHENRLFDRDTLLVLKFNINFLFVLSAYATNLNDQNLTRKIRREFRAYVIGQLERDYEFYVLKPKRDRQEAIDRHLRLLIGKVFSAFGDSRLLFADEREHPVAGELFAKIEGDFDYAPYNLQTNSEEIVANTPKLVVASSDESEDVAQSCEIREDVAERERYVDFLPLYSIKAACGYFEENSQIPADEVVGWVDMSGTRIKARPNRFVIRASGDSMLPEIKDGDLCVFELYGAGNGGSREGEIVLIECRDKDTDYDCHYTIKEYHSTKYWDEAEEVLRRSVDLVPLNTDEYETIHLQLSPDEELRTIGKYCGKITHDQPSRM